MADQDATRGQHPLDHPQAQGKPKARPEGMADHLSREAVASVASMTGRPHPSHMAPGGHYGINMMMPRRP